MTPTESYAWAAGFIDGEGCLDLSGRSPRLRVSNTHLPTLNHLHELFKKAGNVSATKSNNPRARPCFVWAVQGEECVEVLRLLVKYLREKCSQADTLIGAYEWLKILPDDQQKILVERVQIFLRTAKRPSFDG